MLPESSPVQLQKGTLDGFVKPCPKGVTVKMDMQGLLTVLAAAASAAASHFLVGYNSSWTACGAHTIRPTITPVGVAIIAAMMSWSLSLPSFAMYQEVIPLLAMRKSTLLVSTIADLRTQCSTDVLLV